MKVLNMLPGVKMNSKEVILNLDFNLPFVPQVQKYLKDIGDPRGIEKVGLTGQGTAAIICLPALEMLGGLPEIALIPFREREVAGWLNSRTFRHETCREMRRKEDAGKSAPRGFTVIDGGGRGLTEDQIGQLAKEIGCDTTEIRVFSTNPGQVDIADLGGEAGKKIAEGIKSAMIEGQFPVNETADVSRLMFVPHGGGIVATVQALALHGFLGSWPQTVRIAGSPADGFKVREVVDPQSMRQWATNLAEKITKEGAPVLVPQNLINRLLERLGDSSEAEELRALIK